MKLRALCLGLVYIVIFGAAARAEDWKVSRIDGQVSLFRQGSWAKLALGDVVPGDSQLRTFADGSLTAIRGHESLKLAPKSQVQIQERNSPRATLIRQIAGGLSVESAGAETPLTVQTQFTSALLKDGAMVSLVDPAATYLAVRRGSAEITDIAHNRKSILSEGKGAKVNPVRGVMTAATNDPALVPMAAAMAVLEGVAVEAPAAKGFDAPPRGERKVAIADASSLDKSLVPPSAITPTKSLAGEAATLAKVAPADATRASGGSLAADAAALAKVAPTGATVAPGGSLAADAAALGGKLQTNAPAITDDQLRGMAEAGAKLAAGPSPETSAVLQAVGRAEWLPWRKREMSTPFFQYAFGLQGFERFVFWGALVPVYVLLGFALNYVLQDFGFGVLRNSLIAAAASLVGAVIQEVAISEVHLKIYEPGLSLGFLLGSIPLAMLATRFAVNRI